MRNYVSEENYGETMEKKVMPYLSEFRRDGFFESFDGKKLHYAAFCRPQSRGSVTICHGYTESIEKYRELIYVFLRAGFDTWIWEQRGHGTSYRETEDTTVTHVGHFSEYAEDLAAFAAFARKDMKKPRFLYAHSMGGAVAALYLESGSRFFCRAVLSSPMIAPSGKSTSVFAAKLLCRAKKLLGQGKSRVFFYKPYPGHEDFSDAFCSSEERFNYYEKIKSSRREFQNYSPSYSFMLESANARRKILRRGAVERIAVPVKVFVSENDPSVRRKEQEIFAGRLRNGSLVAVRGTKHEIYKAGDKVLFPYLDAVLDFFGE